MKKNEGKIRNIHSHQDRENLKKAEFDSKLYSTMRSNFAKEGKKIAGELENDEKLDYVGDAPDLLNKIVGQLREEGKWDDNAYRQECKKELYDLLPQEDQIALRRGRKLAKIEEKWKRNRKKIMQRAAIIANEEKGRKQDIVVPKSTVAIVENPLYAVINEPNSTMQRLIRKLNLLDAVDEQSSSGKLDLIIQLPYVIKTEARRKQAEKRRKDIEQQLAGSKYGIAYTDGTERITQLNRSLENNLMKQIEYLTSMLYSQLGITQSILDGTADDKTMLNYYNRTIEPIIAAIVDEMKRKFLSKTARSQNKSIKFFRDPFKLVPVADLAEISDKFTRNEIATSNEIRQVIGWKPSNDPKADELRNSNLSQPNESPVLEERDTGGINQNEV